MHNSRGVEFKLQIPRRDRDRSAIRDWMRGDGPPLFLILLTAAFFRFYNLENLPGYVNAPGPYNNGLAVLDLLRRQILPIYSEVYKTPQTMLVYLDAISIYLFGPTRFAIRAVTSAAGVLAVLGTYFLAKGIFAKEGADFARRVGLFAALGLSFSLIDTHLARTGYRAALHPVFQIFFLVFLFKGWRENRREHFALAGIFLGLSLYTYPSALALLGIVPLLLMHQGFFNRPLVRDRVKGLVWLGLALLVTLLPLILLAAERPEILTNRARETNISNLPEFRTQPLQTIFQKWLLQFQMFGMKWEGSYNDFGQPLLPLFFFLTFLIGLGRSLVRHRTLEYGILLPGLQLLLLPDLFSVEEVALTAPYATRVVGIYSWSYLLVGLGLAWLWDRGIKAEGWRGVVPILILGGFLFTAWNSYHRYFVVEAQSPSQILPYKFSLREQTIVAYLNTAPQPILASLGAFNRSQVRYETAARFANSQSIFPTTGGELPAILPDEIPVLITPAERSGLAQEAFYGVLLWEDTVFILPAFPPGLLAEWIEDAKPLRIRTSQGITVGLVYMVPTEGVFKGLPSPQFGPPEAEFQEGIEFLGSTITDFQPGQEMVLNLYWQASKGLSRNYKIFVHLIDDSQQIRAWGDAHPAEGLYPTAYWQLDEIVPSGHRIIIPQGLAPGSYWIEVGFYDPVNNKRLEIINPLAGEEGGRVLLGPFIVP